jgi:hypothetical protein
MAKFYDAATKRAPVRVDQYKGRVRKSISSPNRRMTGYVSIEYLTKSGKALDSDVTKVYRRSPSKHNETGLFKLVRSNLPVDTSAIRIIYNRHLKFHIYS